MKKMKMMKMIKKGQGMVEVVFSIGVVMLILAGIVILMVNTFGAKNKGFDRKKATQLAQMIIEKNVADRDNAPGDFWEKMDNDSLIEDLTEDSFTGYIYNVSYQGNDDGKSGTVTVIVTMPGRDDEVTFERFFGKL
jgi:hypothetical protein